VPCRTIRLDPASSSPPPTARESGAHSPKRETNVTIGGCSFVYNAGQGVQNGSTGNATVNSQGNWWGDPAGPAGPNGDGASALVDASNPLAAPVVLDY
jgi:hypothetical protein